MLQKDCETSRCREKCLYSSLRKEDKAILNKKKIFKHRKRGSTLYEEGLNASALYMINSGVVKVTRESRKGETVTINTAHCCSMVGMESLQTNALYKNSAVAVTDVAVCIIPREQNVNLLKENYKAREWFVAQYYDRMETMSLRIRDFAGGDVRLRIAGAVYTLYRYYNSIGKCIEITREELADMAGTTRETVSRTLTEFKSKKIVEVEGRCIKVLKPEAVSKLAGV
jgi:CRP/FNR family transcriptional regulator